MQHYDIFLAKSRMHAVSGVQVTVQMHCSEVALLARQYGETVGLGSIAEAAGLCHDYGKYGGPFQELVRGRVHGVDHAVPGAVMSARFSKRVSEAVMGHHAGLADHSSVRAVLNDVMEGRPCDLPSGKRPSISGRDGFRSAHGMFLSDHPGFQSLAEEVSRLDPAFRLGSGQKWKNALYQMLLERFLFSCLVDADYTVSCYEETGDMPDEMSVRPYIRDGLSRLAAVRDGVADSSKADPGINSLRESVYTRCAEFDVSKRMYLLSAPTGAGKSFAMMRFALEQCWSHDELQRVIFVLPFLTLTDQVAGLARDVFGDVLVDTSGFKDGPDDRRGRKYMTETWNAPCVVTTTVQFFQSLFSDRPGDCRKLHRIANSVIVFDEIQALPTELSRMCIQSLHWLGERFGCRILISTATPPRYSLIDGLDFSPYVLFGRDDCPECGLTRAGFQVMPEPVPLDQIADMAARERNACVIVNLRAHARQVYGRWQACGVRDVYFITTDLCPDHRRAIISEVSERQRTGLPVHVVSTQCIEAGVDLDFERVFRAWAPLPSLVQSAGRQDRNGRYGSPGMAVFLPLDPDRTDRKLYPSPAYYRDTAVTMRFSDCLGWDAFDGYYRQAFTGFSEPDRLGRPLLERDYHGFAEESRLIRSGGRQVAVPYGDMYDRLRSAYDSGTVTKRDISDAAGILVSTYAQDGFDACCAELVIKRCGIEMRTGVYILLDRGCYDAGGCGLDLSKAEPMIL